MRRRFTGRLGRRSMRRRPIGKMLLLAATLGALTTMPAAASAPGHSSGLQQLASSFGVKIILHDAPKVVQYRHGPRWHLRPQPWPRHFHHHAPRSSWHKPWRPTPWHFHRQAGDHHRWSRGPGRPDAPAFRHKPSRGDSWHGRRNHRGRDR
jgi:hypothetical protein